MCVILVGLGLEPGLSDSHLLYPTWPCGQVTESGIKLVPLFLGDFLLHFFFFLMFSYLAALVVAALSIFSLQHVEYSFVARGV